jgi:hypothetical protein
MAVFKSEAELHNEAGQPLGRGMLYLHLPRGTDQPQTGSGTVALRDWTAGEVVPVSAHFPDGRILRIEVSRSAISDCSRTRVLRFQAAWDGSPAGAETAPDEQPVNPRAE